VLIRPIDKSLNKRVSSYRARVSNYTDMALCSSDRDVEASVVAQKSNLRVLVTPDEGYYDDLLFTALKPVDCVHFSLPLTRQFPSQQANLACIRRNDGNLRGLDSSVHEPLHVLEDNSSFALVAVGNVLHVW